MRLIRIFVNVLLLTLWVTTSPIWAPMFVFALAWQEVVDKGRFISGKRWFWEEL